VVQYDHRYHAANVGDVWKHVALIAWLERARPALFIDTHAGRGAYELGPTGEWTEGLGLLRGASEEDPPPSIARYLAMSSGSKYPGSPIFAAAFSERLRLFELDPAAHRELARNLADPRATISASDGLAGMIETISDEACVLIDPPYQDRREWELVPDAIIAAHARAPHARFFLWYPIKSYARPNAMHARLEKAKLAGTALELLTSPLDSKKNRLNGSGVLLINAPPKLIEELAMLSAWLGPRLALPIPPHEAFWTARNVGFGRV
jgi:23S rRNA (adenine2030-N6)-methyltransferase